MNLFKSLLFLEGHIADPRVLGEEFAPSYGNKVAAERAFRDHFSQPEFGRNGAGAEACSAAGCG